MILCTIRTPSSAMDIKCKVDKPELEDCEKVLEWKDRVPILVKAHKITDEQPAGVRT